MKTAVNVKGEPFIPENWRDCVDCHKKDCFEMVDRWLGVDGTTYEIWFCHECGYEQREDNGL